MKKVKPNKVEIGCVDCIVRVVDEMDKPLAGYEVRIVNRAGFAGGCLV